MIEITTTAQTVDEAVSKALLELNIAPDRADVTVIDPGKKGFLGFGSRQAKVTVKKRIDAVEEVEAYLQSVAKQMGVDVTPSTVRSGKLVKIELQSDKTALLIGKRGQTLNALQYLAQIVANQHSEQFLTITLDAEGYRERRHGTLEQLAKRKADQAVRTRKAVALEPMPSYERKIIHNALSGRRDIQTRSDGTEPHRHLVIEPK